MQAWLERRCRVTGCLCYFTTGISRKTLYVFIPSPASFLHHVPTFVLMICCTHSPKWLGFSNFTGHWHTYVSDALIRMQKRRARRIAGAHLTRQEEPALIYFCRLTINSDNIFIHGCIFSSTNESLSATQGVVAAARRLKSQLCVALIKQIWMHIAYWAP